MWRFLRILLALYFWIINRCECIEPCSLSPARHSIGKSVTALTDYIRKYRAHQSTSFNYWKLFAVESQFSTVCCLVLRLQLMESAPSHSALFLQIRRDMIDGKPGEKRIRTLIKSIDEASLLQNTPLAFYSDLYPAVLPFCQQHPSLVPVQVLVCWI